MGVFCQLIHTFRSLILRHPFRLEGLDYQLFFSITEAWMFLWE